MWPINTLPATMHASVASAAPRTGKRARTTTNGETHTNRDDEKSYPFEQETDYAEDVVWNRVIAKNSHTENDEPDEDNPPASADRLDEHKQGCCHQSERNEVGDPVTVIDLLGIAAQQPTLEQPRRNASRHECRRPTRAIRLLESKRERQRQREADKRPEHDTKTLQYEALAERSLAAHSPYHGASLRSNRRMTPRRTQETSRTLASGSRFIPDRLRS